MAVLSQKALEHKREYNRKRNKALTNLFSARLPKKDYKELCEYLQQQGMNKTEFIRWAFDKLREGD